MNGDERTLSRAMALHTYSGRDGKWANGFMFSRLPWSRADMLDGKCTHHEYYRQFVTHDMLHLVAETIGVKRLVGGYRDGMMVAGTTAEWYSMIPYFHDLYIEYPGLNHRQAVYFNFTLSTCFCILKAAGIMIARDDYDVILVPSVGLLTDGSEEEWSLAQ